MKHLLYILVIVLQVSVIAYLYSAIKTRNNTLGVSINIPQNKTSIPNEKGGLRYFYEPEPNSIDNVSWGGQDNDIHINSQTLNDNEIDTDKSKFNIIALGDSFTYGQFVHQNENWVSQLESKLHKTLSHEIQTVNLGVEGYDIQYAVERFKIRGLKYKPRLVIWLLKGDDFGSVAELLTPQVELEKEIYLRENPNADIRYIFKKGEIGPPYVVKAVKKMMGTFGGDVKNLVDYQRKRIEEFRKLYSGELLIVYIEPQRIFLDLLSELQKNDSKVHLLKLSDIYRTKENYYEDMHPTPKGHEIIADDISKYIYSHRKTLRIE